MAMGKRSQEAQSDLWVSHDQLPRSQGHAWYDALNQVFDHFGFDDWLQDVCASFYHARLGRPSTPPGVYFRCLLVGYFEGIDSERGIAWRCADSLSVRAFLGLAMSDNPPDHSTLSRTRSRIDLDTHQRVFVWVVKMLATQELVKGKTVGLDATTLEANAAMRSIVRRDSGQTYDEYLTGLAQASGIETPTREDLAKVDKTRKNKASNKDWRYPHDDDAKITKLKDGRTHLAHKLEQTTDLDTGAVLAVTLQPANDGDTTTWRETVEETCQNLHTIKDDPLSAEHVQEEVVEELVADKGYHSNETMVDLDEIGIRTYVSEPARGKRKWEGKSAERDAVYSNRRRIRGRRGKQLLRKRGELVERPFAHELDTGGMRRTHLREHANILKRLVVHVAGFNLNLLMRHLFGVGKPRVLQDGRHLLRALCLPRSGRSDLHRKPHIASWPPWTFLALIPRRFAELSNLMHIPQVI